MTPGSNEYLALSLLADATAENAREDGRRIRDERAEQNRQRIRLAAAERSGADILALMGAGLLAITVLIPWLVGHFLLRKTFVLRANPAVYESEARGLADHFLATYLGGLVVVVLGLGIFLVARRPWQGRVGTVVGGWIAVLGALVVLLPIAGSQWDAAEHKTIKHLRETAFPFSKRFYECAGWTIGAENGAHDPELWQVYLAQVKGTSGSACNRVHIYRGWQPAGYYDLPDADTFTGEIIVGYVDWTEPYRQTGSADVFSYHKNSGEKVPMNPLATNIELLTTNGHTLEFTLDVSKGGAFHMK